MTASKKPPTATSLGATSLPARFTQVDIPRQSALMLLYGYDIRTVQQLLPHKDVRATMTSTHLLNRRPAEVRSPVDGL